MSYTMAHLLIPNAQGMQQNKQPYRTLSMLYQLLSLWPFFLREYLKVRIEPVPPEMSQRSPPAVQSRPDPLLVAVVVPDDVADESGDGQGQYGRHPGQHEDGDERDVVLEGEDEHGDEDDGGDARDQDPGHEEHDRADVRGTLEPAAFLLDLRRGLAEFEFSGSAIGIRKVADNLLGSKGR